MNAHESAKIGDLILPLLVTGSLELDYGLHPPSAEFKYRVEWRSEWESVVIWDEGLKRALERVHDSVAAIANYG